LRGLSLNVSDGQVVALLGSNGAGKSTTLKAISRLLELEDGELVAGRINYDQADIAAAAPQTLVRKDMSHVMEGRRIFEDIAVEDKLVAGSYALDGGKLGGVDVAWA